MTIGGIIFGAGLLFAMISCYFGYQNREKAIDESIQSVIQHVDITLNQKYKENLVKFKVIPHKSLTSFQNGMPKKTKKNGNHGMDPDYDDDDDMIKDFTYYNICIKTITMDTHDKHKTLSEKLLSIEDDE